MPTYRVREHNKHGNQENLNYKALRAAGGIRRPLRLLRKEKIEILCGADKGP